MCVRVAMIPRWARGHARETSPRPQTPWGVRGGRTPRHERGDGEVEVETLAGPPAASVAGAASSGLDGTTVPDAQRRPCGDTSAIGRDEDQSIVRQGDAPSAFVEPAVVEPAQTQQVVRVRA